MSKDVVLSEIACVLSCVRQTNSRENWVKRSGNGRGQSVYSIHVSRMIISLSVSDNSSCNNVIQMNDGIITSRYEQEQITLETRRRHNEVYRYIKIALSSRISEFIVASWPFAANEEDWNAKRKQQESGAIGEDSTYSSLATSMMCFLRPARPNENHSAVFYIERHFHLAGSSARKRGRGSPVLNRRGTPRANPLLLPLSPVSLTPSFLRWCFGWRGKPRGWVMLKDEGERGRGCAETKDQTLRCPPALILIDSRSLSLSSLVWPSKHRVISVSGRSA